MSDNLHERQSRTLVLKNRLIKSLNTWNVAKDVLQTLGSKREGSLAPYWGNARVAYLRSNRTKALWKAARARSERVHGEWLQQEKKAHERTRQVLQTYREEIVERNATLPNATGEIQHHIAETEATMAPWRTLLPDLKRQIEEQESSLTLLLHETLEY